MKVTVGSKASATVPFYQRAPDWDDKRDKVVTSTPSLTLHDVTFSVGVDHGNQVK
jgi:hypothetical protein